MIRSAVGVVTVFAGLAAACAPPVPVASDLAARVAGEEIEWAVVSNWMAAALGDTEEAPEPEVSSQLMDQYVDELLLERLARDRGFPGGETADQRLLLAFLLEGSDVASASEAEARSYYEAHAERWVRPDRVRLRQILVEDRALAEEARRRIVAGEGFAGVAETLSEEPLAHLGGDQGYLAREDLPPVFADVIFGLPTGDISPIVPAEYGFHIFQVVDRREAEQMAFEEVAPEIVRTLDRRRIDAEIERLVAVARERYNVTIYRANLPFDYQGGYPTDDR